MNLASHGVDNCVAPAQPQCVNGREQIYASNWHGDYWPMCTATTQQETVLREDPNSKLPQYPRNEAVCSSQEWETFSSLSGFDHVYEAPAPAGLLPDNPSLFKLMWRVEGDHVIGKMVANALFGYLSLGFRNALDLVHNGMNQAVIVHAMPGTWEGPKHGLNLSAGPKVEELYIAHTAFRQWEGPYTRPNDEAGSSLGFLHTTAVTATDCFTAVEFNASGINGTTFNLDGNDELIWAANGEDRYNGYHGRAWRGQMVVNWRSGVSETFLLPPPPTPKPPPPTLPYPPSPPPSPPASPPPPLPGSGAGPATIAGLTVGSVALVGLLALAIYMVYSNLSKRRKGSGRTSDGDEAKPSPSISAAVHHGFYLAFYAWGEYIALHPKRVIGVSLAVSLVCMARLLPFFGPLANELEVENLWVPQGARAYADKLTYDAAFSTSFRRNYLYLTTKPRGGNVLASGVLKELLRLDTLIKHNVTASTTATRRGYASLTRGGGAPLRYADVCVTRSSVSSGAVSFSAERSAVGTFGGWGSGGDETNCLEFGNPLELFYDPETDVYHLDQTDAEIAAIVDSGRGVSELLYPAWSNRTFDVSASFGGIERDAAGRVVSAKAIGIAYLTQDGPEDGAIDEAASAWEDQLNYMIDPIWSLSPPASEGSAWSNGAAGPIAFDSAVVDVFPVTSGAARQEGGKYVARDVIILTAGMGIILLYAILVLAKCHKVKGRALLAVSGCVGVGLSIGVAFSLPNILGFKTNPVVSVLPFILIGLGVDDMFVLVNAMEATPTDHTRAERLGAAMAHAGVSITITSLTDFVAFALGTMSRLPALSTFCVYAAIGIAADFLLQITFFAGFMALDMAREADGRIDCCPCAPPFKPPPAPTITTTADANAPAAATAAPSLKGCCCFPSCGCAPSHEGRLRAFIRRRYVPCLRLKAVKIALLALFVGWGAYSASCAFRLEQDFQFRWFVNDDAPLQRVFDVQDEYFNGTGMPVFAVTPPSIDDDDTGFDYASIAGQQRLLALRQELEANPWILPSSTASWYEMFREAVWKCSQTVDFTGKGPLEDYFRGKPCDRRHCDIGGQLIFPFCAHRKQLRDTNGTALQTLTSWGHSTPVLGRFNPKYLVDADGNTFDGPLESSFIPPDEFYAWLDQFVMDEILGQSVAASDIAWAVDVPVRSVLEVQQGLNATRLRANYKPVEKAATQIQSMASVRASVADARVGATTFPYTFMFLYYESYEIIISEAIMNLGLALVAVFAITLLVLADVRLTLLVMLCVVLVDIDLLGLMYLWGLTIESISIINLVLAIGLSVDYSVHLAHAFAAAQGTRQERVEKALIDVGPAVLHGATSTFLAVAVLGLAQSYVFRTFFKQFFGICVFGVSHGLVLLPIMLSLVGPPAIPLADTKRSDGKPVAGDKLPPMEEDSRA